MNETISSYLFNFKLVQKDAFQPRRMLRAHCCNIPSDKGHSRAVPWDPPTAARAEPGDNNNSPQLLLLAWDSAELQNKASLLQVFHLTLSQTPQPRVTIHGGSIARTLASWSVWGVVTKQNKLRGCGGCGGFITGFYIYILSWVFCVKLVAKDIPMHGN